MNEREALQKMRDRGFVFDSAKGLITDANRDRIARDAAMVTAPNSGVPAVLTTYVDPAVVEILQAPKKAREIFGETKKGDWTTTGTLFKAVEQVGETTPYTDYGNGATADINVTYPYRQNYLAQTHIRYGDQETAISSKATVDLVSEKQRSAATTIDIATNRFYLYGVEGREIYGLLNEPNLPAAITPAVVNGTVTRWAQKSTKEIYDDVLLLASELFTNSQGNIDQTADLVLVVSPATAVLLGKATDFNVSVQDMLKKYFTRLTIVTLPEMAADSGDSIMLIARTVNGAPTAEFGFSEKMRAMRLVAHTSYYDQKYIFGTYGAIVYRPFAIATMAGI